MDCLKNLETVLQEKLFTRLVGENPKSMQKILQTGIDSLNPEYERMYFLYEVVGYLQGSYTHEGVRRWFQRERVQLDGKSPLQLLNGLDGRWDCYNKEAQHILELAKSSTDSGAT